ncbi:MAG: shikimate dehydrogenase [Acidimicrobiia bacterium]
MTARVALVGTPLRRRHSEVMHNAAFSHFGIDARYELRPLETGQLAAFFTEVRGPEWLGFQVTAPYKRAVMSLVDEVEPEAWPIGAINSGIRTEQGRLVGFNTDGPGFARSVENDLELSLTGARVVIAGSGGAARAVVHACLTGGAQLVYVGNRTPDHALGLKAEVDDVRLEAGGFDQDFDHALSRADLVVNATTVGMTAPGSPFEVGHLADHARVLDLVYVPAATNLVIAARARGLLAVNGIGMLVAQAAIAFERWTDVPNSDPVMRQALEQLIQDPRAEA